ncbi:hypothetical protein A2U01_0085239, partial [Trifolium medium]|nr:hypothetical protein [Trifolium medium]
LSVWIDFREAPFGYPTTYKPPSKQRQQANKSQTNAFPFLENQNTADSSDHGQQRGNFCATD